MSSRIRAFTSEDTEAVVLLWERSGLTRPWNDPRADIARKLAVQPELFLVAEDDRRGPAGIPGAAGVVGYAGGSGDTIVGSVMAGYDGHRGWLYYLATAPERRGEGIGRALVAEAEARLVAMGCPKVQLMVRAENEGAIGFYDPLGYDDAGVLVLGKRLIAD